MSIVVDDVHSVYFLHLLVLDKDTLDIKVGTTYGPPETITKVIVTNTLWIPPQVLI